MRQAVRKIKASSKNRDLKVAVIVADFNEQVTQGLLRGALKAIKDSGVNDKHAVIHHVAGSFEVAQLAMLLAKSKRWQAIICLGAIIKGETTHDRHLARAVTDGLLRVALDTGVPIGLGVITTNNMSQTLARSGANKFNRGYAAAVAAISLATHKI